MNLKNEILSIASDLREGSMDTYEAVNQLRLLIGVCKHPKDKQYLLNGYTYCDACKAKWPDTISGLMAKSDEEIENELYKRILKR